MTLASLHAQANDVRAAARVMATTDDQVRRDVVTTVADRLAHRVEAILAINAAEVAAYDGEAAGLDRLTLTAARIDGIVTALRTIAELDDPLGEVVETGRRPNGLEVSRVRVPLGVVGVIYENRPNVTMDVAALCLRSGNAAFLRGSSTAQQTNLALVSLWHEVLSEFALPTASVSLVADTSHETAATFMGLVGTIDCLIPRGGPRLIAAMREHARVPYVLDGDGNCHVYVDSDADLSMAAEIVRNAKMSRPGVCNAAESLLVHAAVADTFIPALTTILPGVEIRGDAAVCARLKSATPATTEDFATEFLGPIISVAVVGSIDEAIAHVAHYGTGHSEAIVSRDPVAQQRWIREVDAAAVVVNASTRFIDGGELGLGGEVGISTQKLHARGPMGLKELTCVKWVVVGKGHVR
ncbi:MAG: glutamate-5-semialdehyde dehydrogenase [Actinobacteria bacterium]|uniref:glutamate-5-semialdehyde dehydrogenase n=1 Tax=freshwater metagenome TaxID=449393 RepID=A0A6J6W1W2_9ZZZZ|nr:glutamate-5-semialdehyde dehydrogenase [Actinomycetota bacterium]